MLFQEIFSGFSSKKCIHKLSYVLLEGWRSFKQGSTNQTCHIFFCNLEKLHTQHKYQSDRIWNSNETGVQARWWSNVKVFTKLGSRDVYNTITNSWEWLNVNYVVNAWGATFLTFYIFRGSRIWEDYIKLCRP
jgi:hypothetical protein